MSRSTTSRIGLVARLLSALLPALLASACASPDPVYYRLDAVPGAARAGGPAVVGLRRLGLPGYLDRSEIVAEAGGGRLQIANFALWGEPLGGMAGRVLAEDLAQRLPRSTILNEAGAIDVATSAKVEVEIQRFDVGPDRQLVLSAQLAVSDAAGDPGHPLATRSVVVTVPVRGRAIADTVAAMDAALGQLADRLAAVLVAVPPAWPMPLSGE